MHMNEFPDSATEAESDLECIVIVYMAASATCFQAVQYGVAQLPSTFPCSISREAPSRLPVNVPPVSQVPVYVETFGGH